MQIRSILSSKSQKIFATRCQLYNAIIPKPRCFTTFRMKLHSIRSTYHLNEHLALINLKQVSQIRSYRPTMIRCEDTADGKDAEIPKYADRPDDCPDWQNPLHHNNPEKQKIFIEDFAPGEEMPIVPLPPIDGSAPHHIQELADDILHLNMLEMNELIQMVQDHFGWTDEDFDETNMIMAAAGQGSAASEEDAAPVEEQTAFDLKLEGFDAKSKIKVIKEVRAIAGLGLKDAKEMVESAPTTIKKGLKKEEAEELKAKLEEIGATIEIV